MILSYPCTIAPSCVTFGNIWVVLNYMLLNQNILLMLIKPDFLGWCWNFMVVILSLKVDDTALDPIEEK